MGVSVNCDQVDANKVQREMYQALKARREAMEELLKKKTEELKLLCIKEGELTGVLPEEMPLAPGEQPPQIRRRVGTAFSLSTKIVDSDNEAANILSRLELEYELQKQITNAAMKLALDKSVAKTVRKQRKQCLVKSETKLKEMEKKLSEVRKSGKNAVRVQPSPSGPPFDGMYCVNPMVDRLSRSICDDTLLTRQGKGKHRLSKSRREKKLIKLRLNRTMDDISTERSTPLNKSCYELPSDSYNSSYHFTQESQKLEISDLRSQMENEFQDVFDKSFSSPVKKRNKRASWHHTAYDKVSSHIVTSRKETAV
ncbi:hypothetical protein ACJMK2_015746 [Sinanodonta woodiana]|uniref:Cytohesin Ubiquitin Protein Inducing domain-containing protein n=1 Tax=Sinanodonta woodiana TaxID=1069815 RepID=A0ABD3USC7_SINWO